jgi:hypothetical protein
MDKGEKKKAGKGGYSSSIDQKLDVDRLNMMNQASSVADKEGNTLVVVEVSAVAPSPGKAIPVLDRTVSNTLILARGENQFKSHAAE